MAGIAGPRDAAPDAGPQVHHDPARGRYRVPRHRHQPPWGRGLGHDAVLLRSPLYVGVGEAGEVRWSSAVLCYCSAYWEQETSRKVCLQTRVEWP